MCRADLERKALVAARPVHRQGDRGSATAGVGHQIGARKMAVLSSGRTDQADKTFLDPGAESSSR
jgi:hypothetical protein